jgi:hypothetical protein
MTCKSLPQKFEYFFMALILTLEALQLTFLEQAKEIT